MPTAEPDHFAKLREMKEETDAAISDWRDVLKMTSVEQDFLRRCEASSRIGRLEAESAALAWALRFDPQGAEPLDVEFDGDTTVTLSTNNTNDWTFPVNMHGSLESVADRLQATANSCRLAATLIAMEPADANQV